MLQRMPSALLGVLTLLVLLGTSASMAAPEQPRIDTNPPARPTGQAEPFSVVPNQPTFGIDDLKQREAQVKALVDKVLECTVCITSSKKKGSGSGVIVSPDGLILTADHVTRATGKDLVIIFPDGRKVKGKVLGANRTRDASMAQITDKGTYPYVDLGKSVGLAKNQWCVSLGHAAGFDKKRTPPIRIGRVIASGRFIVSDCTLIGGDSGGPLFDLQGDLIGIHSNIGASLAQNQHVPIEVYHKDWDRMKKGESWGKPIGPRQAGDPKRPVLGIQLSPRTSDEGVILRDVIPNSPAAKAGVEPEDILVAIDDEPVRTISEVIARVRKMKVGEEVNLQVKRGDELLDFNVKLIRASDLKSDKPKKGDKEKAPGIEKPEAKDRDGDKETPKSAPTDSDGNAGGEAAENDDDPQIESPAHDPQDEQTQDGETKTEEPSSEDAKPRDRSIQDLLKEARSRGGRLKLSPEEMQRLQDYMAKRMGRRPGAQPTVGPARDVWFEQLIAAYKTVVAPAASSTYRVLVDGKQAALATAIAPNTLLTKASEIERKKFEIELEKGRNVAGEVLETFPAYDLALVRIDDESLLPVRMQTENNDLPLGTFVAAVGHDERPAAIGVISVKPRDLKGTVRGYLGVALKAADGGIVVGKVEPQSPAQKAGLRAKDVIVEVDGKTYRKVPKLAKAIGACKPGDRVIFQVLRDQEAISLQVKIGDRSSSIAARRSKVGRMNRMSGQMSDMRSGFPLALQHDCPIKPVDCGGPLVNLDGQVIGINIARAGRIKSYAVPADVIEQLLEKAADKPEMESEKGEDAFHEEAAPPTGVSVN